MKIIGLYHFSTQARSLCHVRLYLLSTRLINWIMLSGHILVQYLASQSDFNSFHLFCYAISGRNALLHLLHEVDVTAASPRELVHIEQVATMWRHRTHVSIDHLMRALDDVTAKQNDPSAPRLYPVLRLFLMEVLGVFCFDSNKHSSGSVLSLPFLYTSLS